MDRFEVAFDAFGEGVGPAHQPAQAGTQRAKPAFGVIGLALGLAAETMGAWWKSTLVGQPEITARGAAAVILRHLLAQAERTVLAAISNGVGHDLAGSPAERHPQPALLRLALHEAPEFIQLQHVAVLAGQERVLERREGRHFFPPPRPSRSGSKPRRCA